MSVWRRAKAHLTPQRSSGNRPMKSTTSGVGSVAPTRSFAGVSRGNDPRGDGAVAGYADERQPATQEDRLKFFKLHCKD